MYAGYFLQIWLAESLKFILTNSCNKRIPRNQEEKELFKITMYSIFWTMNENREKSQIPQRLMYEYVNLFSIEFVVHL